MLYLAIALLYIDENYSIDSQPALCILSLIIYACMQVCTLDKTLLTGVNYGSGHSSSP